jgi:hypothetical protein
MPPRPRRPRSRRSSTKRCYDHFGTGIVEGSATSLTDAVKDPAKFTGKTVRLEGKIDRDLPGQGLLDDHGRRQEPPVMVKFKDYGFFMPKDASGRTAIIEGTMAMKQETVEQTKHYLEDAGKTEEAAKVTEGRKILTSSPAASPSRSRRRRSSTRATL